MTKAPAEKRTKNTPSYKALWADAKAKADMWSFENSVLQEKVKELEKPSPLPTVTGHVIQAGAYISVHVMPLAGHDVKITVSHKETGEQYVYLSNFQRKALGNLLLSIGD